MIKKDKLCIGIKRETSVSLKGVLACMVLICHLSGRVSLFADNILGTLFTAFGYLAVSVFFFLSGYGLRESFFNNDKYVRNFPLKKLFPFLLICTFTILIYLIRDLLLFNHINALDVLQSFFFGKTIVDNGWYLQAQMVFYVLFYLVYNFIKTKRILVLTLLVVLYCGICWGGNFLQRGTKRVFVFLWG